MTISSSLTNGTTVPTGGGGGTGDVVGPASSVNNRVVLFSGATGKLIKDSGLTLAGTNTGDQTSIVGVTGTLAEFNAALTGADFATGGGTVTGTSSGTNTGDQASIVGITGTKAQFDTACTDGNFLYAGDVTQYTDEMAQDAVGAMVDASLTYVDGTPLLQRAALTGAVTAPAGSNATSLGSFTTAQLNAALSDADVATGGGTATGTNTGDQTSVTGNAGTATALQTARSIDGQAFNGTADITVIAPGTVAAASKATPVDADVMPLADSAAANVLKKVTWANIKATLKTYFDTLYQAAGSYLTSGGALGTPSSGTLTNCTGLPIGAGVSGLAAGVAAFLAAPSSANMLAMVTDETGTGSNVFGTAPDITNLKALGTRYFQQGAPASKAGAATLTAAELLAGLIQYTGAAASLTLPTGTLMDAGALAGLAVDRAFEFVIINTSAATVTLAAGATFTIVGTATTLTGISSCWRCRRTAANTWVAYRV